MEHCHPNISHWTLHGLWCVCVCLFFNTLFLLSGAVMCKTLNVSTGQIQGWTATTHGLSTLLRLRYDTSHTKSVFGVRIPQGTFPGQQTQFTSRSVFPRVSQYLFLIPTNTSLSIFTLHTRGYQILSHTVYHIVMGFNKYLLNCKAYLPLVLCVTKSTKSDCVKWVKFCHRIRMYCMCHNLRAVAVVFLQLELRRRSETWSWFVS